MGSFAPRMLQVGDKGATAKQPRPFTGRMSEDQLEEHVLAHPEVLGEPLLVIGQQLREFEEDQDRLDLLAIDSDGDLVLIELKVSEDFRVTDLQALAYAGAYASRSADELAQTFKRYLDRRAKKTAKNPEAGIANPQENRATASTPDQSIEDAESRIVEFLELDGFDRWEPGSRVKIKIVAPNFPQRVLQNVKHLGDEYGMPIEAIAVRLFEFDDGVLNATFERLLPLPGDEEFQMTLRTAEARKRSGTGVKRKPAVVPLLVEAEKLVDGQTLYLHRSLLPKENKEAFDPAKPAFQAQIRTKSGPPYKFLWRVDENSDPELLSPSAIGCALQANLFGFDGEPYSTAVATSFTLEPNGKTLGDVALDEGIWSQDDAN